MIALVSSSTRRDPVAQVQQHPAARARVGLELVHTLEHDSVVCCVRFRCGDIICMYVYI